MTHPKVLVVGINPWVDNTGINTLINFFEEWGCDRIAHVYTRDGVPNTLICSSFFQISESRLVRKILMGKNTVGRIVYNTPTSHQDVKDISKHSFFKKLGVWGNFARECAWATGKWKEKGLVKFVEEFVPDVLFFPTYSNAYMSRLQKFIADHCQRPIILYASDDNYSYKSVSKSPISLFLRYWNRYYLGELFKKASKIMVIAPKAKEEYDNLFNTIVR